MGIVQLHPCHKLSSKNNACVLFYDPLPSFFFLALLQFVGLSIMPSACLRRFSFTDFHTAQCQLQIFSGYVINTFILYTAHLQIFFLYPLHICTHSPHIASPELRLLLVSEMLLCVAPSTMRVVFSGKSGYGNSVVFLREVVLLKW